MKKKHRLVFLFWALLLLSSIVVSHAGEETKVIQVDTEFKNSGVIKVGYIQPTEKRIRLLIEKDGVRYAYNLYGQEIDQFPLQMGNGEYLIRVFENIEGNRYKEIYKETLQVEIVEEQRIFLNSIQEIKWDNDSQAIKKAKELTKNLETDEEKVLKIYDYIINHISYDYEKINQLTYSYLPDIDNTILTGKGICYDYASLFAAMLRSLGIPTKMVKGSAEGVKGYHGWNEVYIKELDKWVIMDTSYDAQMTEINKGLQPYKSLQSYRAEKIY